MSAEAAFWVGVVVGILVDGLLFDWPFRKRGKR